MERIKLFVTSLSKYYLLLLTYLVFITLVVYTSKNVLSEKVGQFPLKDIAFGVWGYGWDGWLYLSIAEKGYAFPNQAFFPVYPLVIHFLHSFLPLTLAYRVNVIFLAILVVVLVKFFLKWLEIDGSKYLSVIIAFLAFPTAFFLQANYTECLFILAAVLFFLALFKKNFILASLIAGLASGIRLNGITLGVVLILSYTLNNRTSLKGLRPLLIFLAKIIPLGLISISGLLAYFIYLQYKFGSFLIFFKAQEAWFRNPLHITNIFVLLYNAVVKLFPNLYLIFSKPPYDVLAMKLGFIGIFENLFLLFGLFLLIYCFKKVRFELYLFSLLNFLLPLSSGLTASFPRYILLMFPLLLFFLGRIREETRLAFVFFSAIIQVLFITLFINNTFVS